MKKKIVGIFVCMMLVITAVSATVNSENNTINNRVLNETKTKDDCGCGVINKIGFRHKLLKEMYKPTDFDELSTKPTIVDTPDYFNWMDFEGQDWISPARDQKQCGSCWLFAAMGALENILNIREGRADLNIDLSEQYVLSCLPRAGNCIGGSILGVFYYIMNNRSSGNNCNGIIPESCFPYRAIDSDGFDGLDYDSDPVLCDEKCEDWQDYLIPISDFGYWYPDGSPEDRDAIKTQIMQHGPVVSAMYCSWYTDGEDNFMDWGYDNIDPDDYFTSSKKYPPIIYHFIVIVGWKDDPSIDNGGYWICKNSWGPEWGYNGFFNIEYGTENIDSFEVNWVDYNPDVIVNWEPVANAGGIYYGDVGQEILFNAGGSFDHEGEIIKYTWDFGDGYNEYGTIATHAYESQGVYPVTLTVVDSDGNAVNDTTWAFIGRLNTPPSTPTINGPIEGKKGIEYDFNFSATDPDGDDIYYYIYWGDIWVPQWIGPFPSGKEITLNHTWVDKLTHIIHVKAQDEYGFKSEWKTQKITIPKTKPFEYKLNIISWFYERFSKAFPILNHLLKLTYESNGEKSIFWR